MSTTKDKSKKRRKKTVMISIGILLAAVVISTLIFITEPDAKKSGATKETAMLVEVVKVDHGEFQPEIVTTGTVQPSLDVMLSPRVGGEIISQSQAFTPGSFVKKGEILMQLDPSDYRNTLQLRKSDLRQAVSDLNIEEGRRDVAKQDYELLEETLAGENKTLVLREPQYNAVKARVEAAQAAVNQAQLSLQRTTIRAPFDAQVISRNVNAGSQVSPGDNLGRLVGMDEYWVIATVPLSKLRWLSFPDDENDKGSLVRINNRSAWGEAYRDGYLYKLVGSLEEQTRLARILISVPDPMARAKSKEKPPLMLNSFVEIKINADTVENVVRISRDYLRENETVWVMESKELNIRPVNVLLKDAQFAYIDSGLQQNDRVVTTNLSTVTNGAKLRTQQSDSVDRNNQGSATADLNEPGFEKGGN